jgi:hypothetical protein
MHSRLLFRRAVLARLRGEFLGHTDLFDGSFFQAALNFGSAKFDRAVAESQVRDDASADEFPQTPNLNSKLGSSLFVIQKLFHKLVCFRAC